MPFTGQNSVTAPGTRVARIETHADTKTATATSSSATGSVEGAAGAGALRTSGGCGTVFIVRYWLPPD